MNFEYNLSNKTFNVAVMIKNDCYEITIDDETMLIQPIQSLNNFISIKNKDINQKVFFAEDNGNYYIFIDGYQYKIEDIGKLAQKSVKKDHLLMDNESEICTPMPGKILKILVNEGDEIDVKQNLVIVEAMKMENNIVSPIKGIVKKINFKEGDIVDTGQPIIDLEPIEEK